MGVDARLVKRLPATRETEAFELDIHLKADNGITVLFGPSGSGKTLTLNCIAGFALPDEGYIRVDDALYFDAATKVNHSPQYRRCGYIFQDHALFPHMSVRDNLLFAASGGADRYRRVDEFLNAFELTSLAERKPAQLSGGQKQRAALARIMVSKPHLLLLDEPTRGLDVRLRGNFYELLEQTRERLRIPIILVTHQIDECFRLGDFVCLLENGRILQMGARDAVLARPASVEAARSLGIYNILPVEIAFLHPSMLRVKGQEILGPDLSGHPLGEHGFLCVLETDVRLARPQETNRLTLAIIDNSASSHGVRVQCEDQFFVTVSRAQWEQLRSSTHLHVILPPAAVHFIG